VPPALCLLSSAAILQIGRCWGRVCTHVYTPVFWGVRTQELTPAHCTSALGTTREGG
jgi:hypothetical protein